MNENQLPIKPEQIIEIIIKRRWFIIIPFCIAMLAGIYYLKTAERVYEAKTLIFVQPQSVPSSVVRPIIEKDMTARINTLKQRIMSRTNLEKIINQFNLYAGPKYEKMFMESKIEDLRKKITVDVTRGGRDSDAFVIAYKGKQPDTVMKVTNSLASFFINENLKVREEHVLGTRNFLQDELEEMRQRLVEHETKLKEYREKYMGGLPEQLDTNLKILTNLNDQLISVNEEIRAVKNRISELKRYEDLEDKAFSKTTARKKTDKEDESSSVDELKLRLEKYKKRYTEKHPDVIYIKKLIEDAESQLKEQKTAQGSQPADNTLPAQLLEARREIARASQDLKNLLDEKETIEKQIKEKKALVENTPHREQELLSIKRNYENINMKYNSLLERQLEAQIAVNMEKKQKGEQFRVIDPAVTPTKPIAPDIRKMVLLFLFAGLGVGAGLIFLLEFLGNSVTAPEEIEKAIAIPVIATIPLIETKRQKKINLVFTVMTGLGILASGTLFCGFIGMAVIYMMR